VEDPERVMAEVYAFIAISSRGLAASSGGGSAPGPGHWKNVCSPGWRAPTGSSPVSGAPQRISRRTGRRHSACKRLVSESDLNSRFSDLRCCSSNLSRVRNKSRSDTCAVSEGDLNAHSGEISPNRRNSCSQNSGVMTAQVKRLYGLGCEVDRAGCARTISVSRPL
jgi:hypothetical protein